MNLFAEGAKNQYGVLPTNALGTATSSSTSHVPSYPVRYNTLCIQTTPLFSKCHHGLNFVKPAIGVAKDASSTIAILAISTAFTSNALPVGEQNLKIVTSMNSLPSFSRSSSLVNSVARIATALPRYVAFVNSWPTLHVLRCLVQSKS